MNVNVFLRRGGGKEGKKGRGGKGPAIRPRRECNEKEKSAARAEIEGVTDFQQRRDGVKGKKREKRKLKVQGPRGKSRALVDNGRGSSVMTRRERRSLEGRRASPG